MNYQTIKTRFEGSICYIQLYRPEANNTISDKLIDECGEVLSLCEQSATVVIIEGLPDMFCFGADFDEIQQKKSCGQSPEPLYDIWAKLAGGPYISIAHVRGKVNAGGIGFVAACDIVLANESAMFSLSELLFGLYPACVLPFLMRRIGYQKANYLTLTTQPVNVHQAQTWGLVDAYDEHSEVLLQKQLLRLRRLPKTGITRYKRYMTELNGFIKQSKSSAVAANQEMFSDEENLRGIFRYMDTGQFPWEA